MEKRIERILKDLYRIDPALRDREEDMKKVIREMLESKPDAEIDPAFERELKEKLLAGFSEEERRKVRPFIARPAFFIPAASAAAACLVLLLTLRQSPLPAGKPYEATLGAPAEARAGAGTARAADGPAAPKASATRSAEAGRSDAAADTASPAAAVSGAAPSSPKAAEPLAAVAANTSAGEYADEAPREKKEALRLAAPVVRSPAPAGQPAAARPPSKSRIAGGPLAETASADAFAVMDEEAAPAEARRYAAPQAAAGNGAFNTEAYDRIRENDFRKTVQEPLSTFSIDVDTASYANVRRFLESGELPPKDAVRIEELVNYFTYSYAEPADDSPLAWNTELAPCPWNRDRYLLRLGVQAKRVSAEKLPPSNLVFLIDVSGSMEDENKLPLVKESLRLLVKNLRSGDRISIVVYSGAAGLVLEPTRGDRKEEIMEAIENLEAGGSTAGGEGIELAYATAKKAFLAKGNNRVILATDGDFNVGASSDGAMVRLIEEKRKTGIFLTVLGFGMGNYKDSKMQKLADAGNGNYAYVDTLAEARKVLEKQMAGTLYTLAKDVKIQIEFNPATVSEYRLVGYEKRLLAAQDFDDDAKDAGELGAGHSVTVFYEIVASGGLNAPRTDLKYQKTAVTPAAGSGDLMTLKLRYKEPDGDASLLRETAVPWAPVSGKPSADFRFAAAVAEWGLLLRDSAHKGDATYAAVLDLAAGAVTKSNDAEGYRSAFLGLAEASRRLAGE